MKKRLSKLMSFFLALAMIIGILPAIAHAEETENVILNEIYLTIDKSAWTLYQVGQDAMAAERQLLCDALDVGEANKDMYSVDILNTALKYVDGSSSEAVKEGDAIEEGKKYRCHFIVDPKNQYNFNRNKNNITVYLNGVKVTPILLSYNEYWKCYRIELDIPFAPAARPEAINITDFEIATGKVKAGRTSKTSIESKNVAFEISKLEWTCDNDSEFKAGDVFKENSTYKLALTLTPNKGYKFSVDDKTKEYNGKYIVNDTNYSTSSCRMDGSDLILEYKFKTNAITRDIYLTVDYSAWSKFKEGADGGEAADQFKNEITGVIANDIYYLNIVNTHLIYVGDGNSWYLVKAGHVISKDVCYMMRFSVSPRNGQVFDDNSENMNVYINGTKVETEELTYNEYWGNYVIVKEVPVKPMEDVILTGWQKVDDNWYYYDKTGVKQVSKWIKSGTKWYYVDANGVMQTSKWINGNYYVKADGTMAISEFVDKGNYYVGKDGKWDKGTKWIKSGGKWYYIVSGKVQKSKWMQIGKKWYHFNKDGIMETSKWIGRNYYVKADGTMAISEFVDNGNYYVGKDGKWDKGTKWLKSGDKWYYIVSGKVQKSKWVQISKKWYHFDKDGIMETSKWIGGKYYVKADGTMAISEWVDAGKYYVGADGKWIKGYKK